MRIGSKFCLAAGLLALAAPARAATIPNGNYTGTGTGGSATSSVTNNFLGTGINLVVNSKSFKNAGYIDISYPVANSGGTKPYAVTEGVTNSTGPNAITGYVVEVGTGTGANFKQTAPAGYMFGTPTSSNMGAGALSHGNQTITYSGGAIGPGATGTFTFTLAVPNSALTHFTLREVATLTAVPEPSSLAMAGLGVVGALPLVWRRSRRRSS